MKKRRTNFENIERTLGRIFLVLISVILTLVAAEFTYRAIRKPTLAWRNITDAYGTPRPYVMFTRRLSEGNSGTLGYLGPMPSKIKPPREKRIFVVGGSVVEMGEPSWVKILEDKFRASNLEHVKVYNFGVAASVLRQDLVRILIDISGYSPDLIVSYQGFNGTIVSNGEPRINYPQRFILQETNPVFTATAAEMNWLPLLMLGSQIARDFFRHQITDLLSPEMKKWNEERKRNSELLAQGYVQNLRLANVISRGFGANFIAFFQPTAYFKKHLKGEGELLEIVRTQADHARKIRELVVQEVNKAPGQFEFHDLSELFANEEREVFRDRCHYKFQWVQEAVADHLFPILRAALEKPPQKETSFLMKGIYPEEIFHFGTETVGP